MLTERREVLPATHSPVVPEQGHMQRAVQLVTSTGLRIILAVAPNAESWYPDADWRRPPQKVPSTYELL